MKLFNKQTIALLICVITINVLCVTSVSYAYFTANIEGNDSAKNMVVKTGTMEITYTDSDEITLENAIPGDSVKKQFKVENKGTLATNYNIKLNITNNDFEDKDDLKITLKRTSGTPETLIENKVVPATPGGYILTNVAFPEGTTDTYELTISFNKDDSKQNDNAGKTLALTVNIDNEQNATLIGGY